MRSRLTVALEVLQHLREVRNVRLLVTTSFGGAAIGPRAPRKPRTSSRRPPAGPRCGGAANGRTSFSMERTAAAYAALYARLSRGTTPADGR